MKIPYYHCAKKMVLTVGNNSVEIQKYPRRYNRLYTCLRFRGWSIRAMSWYTGLLMIKRPSDRSSRDRNPYTLIIQTELVTTIRALYFHRYVPNTGPELILQRLSNKHREGLIRIQLFVTTTRLNWKLYKTRIKDQFLFPTN